MGLIKCERHGFSSIVFTCSHIRKSIESNDNSLDGIIISKMPLGDFLGKEPFFTYAYCADCAEAYSLPFEGGVLSEDFEDNNEFQPVCGQCFTELKTAIEST